MKKLVVGCWLLVVGALAAGAARAAELPAGYTAVDHIIAPPGAYIDTLYTANGQTKVVMDAVVPPRWEQNDRFGVLFGSRTMTAWMEKAFALQMCTGNSETLDTVRFVYNGAYRQDGGKPFSFGERVTVTCDGQHVEWTGSKAASVAFAADPLASSKSTLYIFADNTVADDGAKSETGLNHSVMQLYSFKIYEGGTLKRDFVPCVRLADAVAGLYDMVEGKFYENSGAGNFGVSDTVLPFGRELASGMYEINESFAFVAPKMESALKVADGATVTLKIAAGVTVALRGGDAFEVWGGGAGLEVPANAKLYVVGDGTLNAFGGRAANGADGVAGGNGSGDNTTGNFTSGAGGAGGWGGGGAGAGIGGHGASGGGGGNGGKAVTSYGWEHEDRNGQSGDNGGNGKNGGDCGALSIGGTVKVFATGGAAGDADGAGGATGTKSWGEGSLYWFGAYGGGGGGGGEKGGAAADIGGGGAGGYGGGGGGSGAYVWGQWSTVDEYSGWGAGGKGANDGSTSPIFGTTYGGSGGAKGAAGTRGCCRSLTIAETATVVAENRGPNCILWISENDYILMEQDKLYHVVNGVRSEFAYSTVDANTATLGNGWYLVKGTVSCGTITVNGTARLILWDGCDLMVTGGENQPGIAVTPGNALEIFGALTGSGKVTAKGGVYGAGIGGGADGGAGGAVTINGGKVTAKGGGYAAGIGGGHKGAGGVVTINGGEVTAAGGAYGAGIGGGAGGGAGGIVTINGGNVTAQGSLGGANIGGGTSGSGGSLTLGSRVRKIDSTHYREGVTVSFEIPDGLTLGSSRTDGGLLIMTGDGASRTAFFLSGQCLTLCFQFPGFEWRLVGDAEVSFGPLFGDCVIDASQLPKVMGDADRMSVDYILPNGETARAENVVALYSTSWAPLIGQGNWYVVTGEVTTARIKVNGEANLILADGAMLTVNGGIGVDVGATLNIYGQSAGTGKLIANGAENCAGIGGGDHGASGAVTINGSEVTATGGYHCAGIGGGYYGAGGTVTINGGTVTATGSDGGAGIGGGDRGADGTVTLDETKVVVVEGAYGNGSSYVKIVEKPTCEGGTIAWSDAANAWVITPAGGVTEVTVTGLSEGDFVAVPTTVTKVSGVADTQIKVRSGAYDITGAFTVSGGEIALNPNGAVTIGGEEIPVKPTIGDLDDGEPFMVDKGVVMVAVRAIPGLRYALVRGETVEGCRRDGGITEDGGGTVIESVVATGARVALSDSNPPEDGAFYVISVSCPAAVGPSDSTIRIVGGRVYSGQYDITDAVTICGDGTVELKAGGVVGGVKVTPVIGDLPPSSDSVDDAASPLFLGGKDGVALTLETIPGLCYGLLRGETPDKVDALVDWHWAESETMTLRDFNPPKDGAFYRIVVKIEEF